MCVYIYTHMFQTVFALSQGDTSQPQDMFGSTEMKEFSPIKREPNMIKYISSRFRLGGVYIYYIILYNIICM